MRIGSLMIDAAKVYEGGGLTKDQFVGLQRQEQQQIQALREVESARTSAAVAQSLDSMSNSFQAQSAAYRAQQPVTCTTTTLGNSLQTSCR